MLVTALNRESAPAATGTANAPQPRLVKAAHEFEAMMLKELLKPLTAADGLTSDEENSGAGSSGPLAEFASESLGRALSERGGLGIAAGILHSLSHPETPSRNATVTRT